MLVLQIEGTCGVCSWDVSIWHNTLSRIRGFVWLIRRGWDLMVVFIGPLYISSQITIWHTVIVFDWTLSISHHTSLIHYSVLLLRTPRYSFVVLQFLWLCSVIICRHGYQENTVFCCQECVFIGPLPNNGWPTVREHNFGIIFTEPLPSNGHMRHNTYWVLSRFIEALKQYRYAQVPWHTYQVSWSLVQTFKQY
jgi:hypothetical protein